jgi:DNA-binding transcriptional LysR family regulator
VNLKRLQAFVLVADQRSFSEVAAMLDMTQSGISRQIKALEEEVGIQLLHRNTSTVQLTAAGQRVYKTALSMLSAWDQLLQECSEHKDELSGVLKVGASTIPGTYLLPRIIKQVQSAHPKVEFCIRIDDSSDITAALESKQIDVALVGSSLQQGYYHSQQIAKDRLVLIGKNKQPCPLTREALLKELLIAREKGSGTREAIDKALRQCGIDARELQYAAEVSTTEAILAMVDAGIGIAFVSYWAVKDRMPDSVSILCELPTDRCFYIGCHESRRQHPIVDMFLREAALAYAEESTGSL